MHDELHATCPGSYLLRARAQPAGMAAAAPLLPRTTRARMMDAYTEQWRMHRTAWAISRRQRTVQKSIDTSS